MGEAAPQAAVSMADGGHSPEAVRRALKVLQSAWGDLYMFGHDEQGPWAARLHRPGTEILRADTPEELGKLLAADFQAELS
jgi:hypothetical protein